MNMTTRSARQGVNVVIWFAISLSSTPNGTVTISGGPPADCMAAVAKELDDQELPTTHLISVGGWDAPHLPSGLPGDELFDAFAAWT